MQVGFGFPVHADGANPHDNINRRNDFYQTYSDVIVSIFSKKVDKERAMVEFTEQELKVDLPMPDSKRYKMSFPLYGPISPGECSFMVLATKVEIKLKKGRRLPLSRYDSSSVLTPSTDSRHHIMAHIEVR